MQSKQWKFEIHIILSAVNDFPDVDRHRQESIAYLYGQLFN